MKSLLLFLFLFCSKVLAGDIAIVWDETVQTVSTERKAEAEAVRSLADWLIVSNNMPEGQGVVTFKLIPTHMGAGGAFAYTIVSGYTYNLDGKLLANPEYFIRIHFNVDGGFTGASKAFFQASLFHEMMHGLGFDAGVWYYNGYVAGPVLQTGSSYTGPALAIFQQEYDPLATFIPVDASHFTELMDPQEVMTPGLSNSGILDVYVSATMLAIIADNGWTVREGFTGGLLIDLMPKRRLVDEDPVVITLP